MISDCIIGMPGYDFWERQEGHHESGTAQVESVSLRERRSCPIKSGALHAADVSWRSCVIGRGCSVRRSVGKWGGSRTPEEVKVLVDAFEDTLRALELVDREDRLTMTVAKLIIQFAKADERDPVHLRDMVLKTLRP
jgi:hypothetical protein